MNKLIKYAVSAALVGGAQVALALPPSAYNDGVNVEHEIYMSGATAQDRLLEAIVRIDDTAGVTNLCVPGTLTRYTANFANIDGVAGNVTARAYTCTADNNIGTNITAGSDIFFHKEAGGSAKGFTPFGPAGDTRRFLNLEFIKDNVATKCTVLPTTAADGQLSTMANYSCSFTAADVTTGIGGDRAVTDTQPVAGISDVDGNAIVDPEVTDAVIATVVETPRNALVFGVGATVKLRNALQQAQGLTIGSNTEADMPSISTAQMRAILSASNVGKLTINSYFTNAAGAGLNGSTNENPSNANLFVCRRAVTSGTQASFATQYLGEGCTAGAPSVGGPANSGSYVNGSALRIFSGTGSGDVTNCLIDRNNTNRWAIGLVTTELEGNGSDWGFVKIDGYAPTLLNTVLGNYTHFAEQVVTYGGVGSFTEFGPATQDDDEDFVNYLIDNLGQEVFIDNVNDAFDAPFHPWGDGGYLALRPTGTGVATLLANQGTPVTAAGVASYPMLRSTRLGKGCVHPQLEIATPATNGQ